MTNMIAPYRIPVFNRLAQATDLVVAFAETRSANRQWDVPGEEIAFSYDVLSDKRRQTESAASLGALIWHHRPEAMIVGGWGFREAWLAAIAAHALRTPIVLWAGLSANSAMRQGVLSDALRRWFVGSATAWIAYSRTSAEHLIALGANWKRMSVATNVGDVSFFHTVSTDRPRRRAPHLLFVGELSARKGVLEMLDAFERIPPLACFLTIAGAGPLDNQVRRRVELSNGRVKYVGYQPRRVVRALMADADVLVLPSLREVGAIVISEALAAGLFVMASVYDGVAPDLISRDNGVFFDPGTPSAFDRALMEVVHRYAHAPWSARSIGDTFLCLDPVQRYADALFSGILLALNRSSTVGRGT